MHHKLKQLLSSVGLRQSLISMVGNTGATAISAVALLIISRVLGPTLFSQFSVGFAIVIMLNKFNDAGLNATLLKYAAAAPTNGKKQDIFNFTTQLKLVLTGMILIIGLAISPWLARQLHFAQPTIIYLSFILSFASSWYEHLLAMLQSLHRFGQAVIVNGIQSTTKLLGIGALLALNVGAPIPIFVWYMVSPAAPLLFTKPLLPEGISFWSIRHQLPKVEQNHILQMAKHSALGFIAAGIIENIDILFVQRYLSDYETGLLGGISRIAMMVSLVGYSLGNVLYPRVARYQTREHLAPFLRKAWLILGVSALGFLAFLPFGKLLIQYTIGPEYLPGVGMLYVLTASSFLTLATIPFLALFYSFKANWYFSVSGILQLIIVVAGNSIFVPTHGLDAAVWTRFLVRLFLLLFTITTGLLYYQLRVRSTDAQ